MRAATPGRRGAIFMPSRLTADEGRSVISSPQVEIAVAADIAELVALRAEQGWHLNRGLLAATLGHDGTRCLVVRHQVGSAARSAAIVAAAFALAAGPVGVVGNVVVRPEHQRRGLGRTIMKAALAWQHARGVRSVLLDATVAGRPLYRRLGFVPVGARSWFAMAQARHLRREWLLAFAGEVRATPRPPGAISHVAEVDRMAFGGDRHWLLTCTLAVVRAWLYMAEDAAGAPLGYLVARMDEDHASLLRIGPWVARTPAGAAALLAAVLAPGAAWRAALAEEGEPVLSAALPGYNPDALLLWQRAGGAIEVDDLIMQLDLADGPHVTPAEGPPRRFAPHPEWMYAWLSPMTF